MLFFKVHYISLAMACNVYLFSNWAFYYYVKVPSFPDDIAMALLEEELGQPWQAVYSELSPSPIAAGNYTKEPLCAALIAVLGLNLSYALYCSIFGTGI